MLPVQPFTAADRLGRPPITIPPGNLPLTNPGLRLALGQRAFAWPQLIPVGVIGFAE